jgi:hypothetical protein
VGKKNNKKATRVDPVSTNEVVVVHQYPKLFEWLGSRLGSISEALASNKAVLWITLILLALVTLIQFPQSAGGDYDLFFHLKYGELYFKNHTWILDHSQFSWTPSIADWKYVTWIGDILIYLFYNIVSGNGLLLLQWLIFLGIFFMVLKFIRLAGDQLDLFYVLMFLFVMTALSLIDMFIKPDLFTTLFFCAAIFIYFYVKITSKNIFYFYPFLFLIWVNTHGGFVMGFAFLGLVWIGEVINYFFFKKAALPRTHLYTLTLAGVLSFLAGLINPYGFGYYTAIVGSLSSSQAYESLAKPLFAYQSLWGHVLTTNAFKFNDGAWALLVLMSLFVFCSLYMLVKKRLIDAALLLTGIFFFFFSMSMARAIKFFPLVAIFSVVYMVNKADLVKYKRKIALVSLIVFLLGGGRLVYQTLHYVSELPNWDYSRIENNTPMQVADFVKKNKLPGPIFNDYLSGGYLMWALYPDYKVFIDPRQTPYVNQVWPDYQAYTNTTPLTPQKLELFTRKYPFKIAIVHYAYLPTIVWFLSSPDWKLIDFDSVAALIINKSVIPALSKNALATEVGTKRFVDIKSAGILQNLFYFYVQIGPQYARDIIEIYRKNVNDYYVNKQAEIQQMELVLQQKTAEQQQRAAQLQQKKK